MVGVHPVQGRRKLGQRPVHHGLDAPDGMTLWNQGVGRNRRVSMVACHPALPGMRNLPTLGTWHRITIPLARPVFQNPVQVPPQYPEPAFRPLDPELCLEQILCFKHRGRVAEGNTVRFQLHTLQLLPGPERPSYAGAAVEVLEGLDGRLSVRHEGRILAAQQAPPSPVLLRNGHGPSPPAPAPPSGANGLGERWVETLEPLHSRSEY